VLVILGSLTAKPLPCFVIVIVNFIVVVNVSYITIIIIITNLRVIDTQSQKCCCGLHENSNMLMLKMFSYVDGFLNK